MTLRVPSRKTRRYVSASPLLDETVFMTQSQSRASFFKSSGFVMSMPKVRLTARNSWPAAERATVSGWATYPAPRINTRISSRVFQRQDVFEFAHARRGDSGDQGLERCRCGGLAFR